MRVSSVERGEADTKVRFFPTSTFASVTVPSGLSIFPESASVPSWMVGLSIFILLGILVLIIVSLVNGWLFGCRGLRVLRQLQQPPPSPRANEFVSLESPPLLASDTNQSADANFSDVTLSETAEDSSRV